MKSLIKKARLLARRTQAEVADRMGVSQPTYQRWESGSGKVPKSKAAQLAQVLGITVRQVQGQQEPVGMAWSAETSSDQVYYGELAIHFQSGSPPLLLPISDGERKRFFQQIECVDKFIPVESLDNRIVFVRRNAIADAYLCSDAYDEYGPDDYGDQLLDWGHDEQFWHIVEHMDSEFLDEEINQAEIDAVLQNFYLSDERLVELIAQGRMDPEDRKERQQAARDMGDRYQARASQITWQLPGNRTRVISIRDNLEVYNAFWPLTMGFEQELLYLAPEGYDRSIFINLASVDCFTIPAHKYRDGEVDNAAADIGETP